MDISTIQGIPAHPLLIHIPVIGIPVCALMILLYVIRPAWREGLRVPTALVVAFTAIATVFAAGSGEKLESMMSPEARASSLVHAHTELGDQTKAIVIVFGIVTILYLAIDWYRIHRAANGGSRISSSTLATGLTALGILAIVLGGVSTVWDVRTGHAGAKATWHDALPGQVETTTNSQAKEIDAPSAPTVQGH